MEVRPCKFCDSAASYDKAWDDVRCSNDNCKMSELDGVRPDVWNLLNDDTQEKMLRQELYASKTEAKEAIEDLVVSITGVYGEFTDQSEYDIETTEWVFDEYGVFSALDCANTYLNAQKPTLPYIFVDGNNEGNRVEITALNENQLLIEAADCCVPSVKIKVTAEVFSHFLTQLSFKEGGVLAQMTKEMEWAPEVNEEFKKDCIDYMHKED